MSSSEEKQMCFSINQEDDIYESSDDNSFLSKYSGKRSYTEFKKSKPRKKRKQKKKMKNLIFCFNIYQLLLQIFKNDPVDMELYDSISTYEKKILLLIINNKFINNKIEDNNDFCKYLNEERRFILTSVYSKNDKTKLLKRLINKIKKYNNNLIKLDLKKLTYANLIQEKDKAQELFSILNESDKTKSTNNIYRIINKQIDENFYNKLNKIEQNFLKLHKIKNANQKFSSDLQQTFYIKFLKNLTSNKDDKKSNDNSLFKNFNNLPIPISDINALQYELSFEL